jgi:hypothetical protein
MEEQGEMMTMNVMEIIKHLHHVIVFHVMDPIACNRIHVIDDRNVIAIIIVPRHVKKMIERIINHIVYPLMK